MRPSSHGDPSSVADGILPRALFKEVIAKFQDLVITRQARLVQRTE